ncbi:intraflagellar transport protein 22 homolog [Patiria miniata]|uniref:Intraflagellar transport protein 22 homolog n=1 Tax=Patiria miniata TaxID=46514 RepID=A0A914A746_PATMI|nr:intraflagellar transport protein 22 homolog [Patiria miniata]
MLKAKILVVGPCESGKSVISNFLADATETSGGEYHPTQGVRILEFESGSNQMGARSSTAEVELWDCSGDQKFDECWPAIMKDANGVVIVYNPDVPTHERELDMWYSHFVVQQALREAQCLIMGHHKPSAKSSSTVEIPSSMSKVHHIQTNLEEDAEGIRREFNRFLGKLLGGMSRKQDQEELSIIQ